MTVSMTVSWSFQVLGHGCQLVLPGPRSWLSATFQVLGHDRQLVLPVPRSWLSAGPGGSSPINNASNYSEYACQFRAFRHSAVTTISEMKPKSTQITFPMTCVFYVLLLCSILFYCAFMILCCLVGAINDDDDFQWLSINMSLNALFLNVSRCH